MRGMVTVTSTSLTVTRSLCGARKRQGHGQGARSLGQLGAAQCRRRSGNTTAGGATAAGPPPCRQAGTAQQQHGHRHSKAGTAHPAHVCNERPIVAVDEAQVARPAVLHIQKLHSAQAQLLRSSGYTGRGGVRPSFSLHAAACLPVTSRHCTPPTPSACGIGAGAGTHTHSPAPCGGRRRVCA